MLKKTQGSTMGTWHIRLTGAIRLEWQPVEGKAEIYVPRFTSRAVQALFVYLTIHRANTTRDRLVADLDIAGRDKKRDPRKVLANQLYYLRRDLRRACPDTLPTDTLIQTVRDTMQLASEATVDIASIDDVCRLGENHPRLEKALLEAALLDPDQVAPGLRQGWIEAERARLHEKLPQVQRRLAQRQEKVRLETATLLSPQRPIFVGRESFLHDLDSLFDRGTTLVTLLGPSGVGKTRIATEFTRQAIVNGMHRFKRIVFVPLADLKSIPEVISAMGSALDCADGRITEKLQQNPILCVLDNLEHLLSVPEIRERLQGHLYEWLHGTPSAFLITSQTPVGGLAEEVLVNVAPLAIPTSSDTTVKELQKVSSVCLLEELLVSQREKIVPSDHRRDFHLNEKNAFFFRNTCILSGGIPLFLELIVPHTLRAKTFQEIDRALRRDLLSRLTQIHSSTTSDLRHHTMRAAIAWSVALLPIPIHSFLAHLSFFRGAFTTDDVAAILEQDPAMAKAFLSHLEQFSLSHSTEDNQYYLLESVRAYASEKATDFLTEARMQHLTARHAKYFASRAVSLFPSILVEGGGERLPERLTEMERRLPDMRFALQTLAKEQEWELLSLLSSSLLAFSLLRIVYATDILSLVQERFDKMQEIPSAAEAYADLRIDLARVAISRGQLDYGLSLCQEQIRLSIDSTDPNERRREAPARECSTVAFAYARQFDTAKAEGEEALRLFVAQGDTVGEARACHTLVNICRSMNRDEEGIHFGERSIALSRRSNRLHDVARTLSAIALPYWFGRQDKETAYAVAHEALELNRCLGLQGREVISLRVLADVCATTGDVSGGERYARQALRLARQLDRNGFEEAMSYKVLGCAVLKQNRPVQAMRFLCRAVVLLLSGNVISQVAEILYYVVEAMGIGAGINRDMLPKIRNARQELLNPNASQCERDATLATVREFAQTNELLISE